MKRLLLISFLFLVLATPAYSFAQDATTITAPASRDFSAPVVRAWFDRTYAKTEKFRKKQAVYFITIREELKRTLKIETKEPDPTIDIGIGGDVDAKREPYAKMDNPLDYAKYIFAISMSTLFSNAMIFYITALLLTLIVVRFIVSRLV